MDFFKKNGLIILIFIVTLSLRVFWINQKNYIFHDSVITYSSSTPNNKDISGKKFKLFWDKFEFTKNYKYTGKQLKEMMFKSPTGFSALFEDIKSLYLIRYDYAHSDFYAIISRIWNYNLQDINLKNIIIHGCGLNLLLFSFSFFIMYRLLQLLVKDKRLIPIVLTLAFTCAGSLSATLLIREYQLQETCLLLTTYVFVKIYQSIVQNKNLKIFNKKNYIFYAFTFAITALSGYYALIYEGLLLFVLFVLIFKNIKINKTLVIYALGFFLTVLLFTLLLDPNFFSFLKSEHTDTSIKNIKEFLQIYGYRLNLYFQFIIKLLYFNVFIFILFLILLIKKIFAKNYDVIFLLIIIANISAIFIMGITPYPDSPRYILPLMPILSLWILWVSEILKLKYFTILASIYLFFLIILSSPYFVHEEFPISFENKLKYPLIVYKSNWFFTKVIFDMEDNQIVMFVDKIPDKNFEYKKYILLDTLDGKENVKALNPKSIAAIACNVLELCYFVIENK